VVYLGRMTVTRLPRDERFDATAMRVSEPTVESVMAGLNPKGVPLTDGQTRRILREAKETGRLFPREILRLTEAGWLAVEPRNGTI
jgi:hypothetical protein